MKDLIGTHMLHQAGLMSLVFGGIRHLFIPETLDYDSFDTIEAFP